MRSAIACAASRFSGTSRNNPSAVCGPPTQRAGASAATASQSVQKIDPIVGRSSRSDTSAVRTARTRANKASGKLAGARSFSRLSRFGRSHPSGSGGLSNPAKNPRPCCIPMWTYQGAAISSPTASAIAPATRLALFHQPYQGRSCRSAKPRSDRR